eukprot:3208036-Amphidinium_carterae.1
MPDVVYKPYPIQIHMLSEALGPLYLQNDRYAKYCSKAYGLKRKWLKEQSNSKEPNLNIFVRLSRTRRSCIKTSSSTRRQCLL